MVAIAAGGAQSLALRSDGTVVEWGNGGAITVPAGLSNVVAIAAGGSFSAAITIGLAINSIALSNRYPVLGFHTFSGEQYSVQYSPGLNPASWLPLPGGQIQGNGYDAQVVDTSAPGQDQRFYRVQKMP